VVSVPVSFTSVHRGALTHADHLVRPARTPRTALNTHVPTWKASASPWRPPARRAIHVPFHWTAGGASSRNQPWFARPSARRGVSAAPIAKLIVQACFSPVIGGFRQPSKQFLLGCLSGTEVASIDQHEFGMFEVFSQPVAVGWGNTRVFPRDHHSG
jgi:hypothetical protein